MYIKNEYDKMKLPEIYNRNKLEYFLDPIRERFILKSPEEVVRQKTVQYFIEILGTPIECIMLEQHMKHYNIDQSKDRVDIVVHSYNKKLDVFEVLAIVECKAENVSISENTLNQALRYANILESNYLFVTNGIDIYGYAYYEEKNEYLQMDTIPSYGQMLNNQVDIFNKGMLPQRLSFDTYFNVNYIRDIYSEIGKSTPDKYIPFTINLWEGFLDTRRKLSSKKYKYFELISDYGIRLLEYGNAGGGKFFGPYRSFIIKDLQGNNQIVSFSLSTYTTDAKPDIEKTSLNVAIDTEKSQHHSLQLIIDDNVKLYDNEIVKFFHHGKIAIGNKGSGKIAGLKKIIYDNCPELLQDDKIYLGKIHNKKYLYVDDKEFENLIENLISYALIRDVYRSVVKNA